MPVRLEDGWVCLVALRSLACAFALALSALGALTLQPGLANAQTATRDTSLVAVPLLAEDRNQSVFKLLFTPRASAYEIKPADRSGPALFVA